MNEEKLPIEIYVEDDSENANLLYKNKGERKDVYIKHQNKYFKMTVISFTALKKKLNKQFDSKKLYLIDANLIVVKDFTLEEIIFTTLELAKWCYFVDLKECEIKNGNILYYSSDTEDDTIFSFPISELKRIY